MNKLTQAAKEEASLIVADMPHTALVILAEKDLRRSFNARNLPKCALILAARERIAKEATQLAKRSADIKEATGMDITVTMTAEIEFSDFDFQRSVRASMLGSL